MDAKVLAAAVVAGAVLLHIGGEVYAAYPYDDLGWWVSKLEHGSPDYFVSRGGRCSCPAWSPQFSCKHAKSCLESLQ